jgi:hypothetical protein
MTAGGSCATSLSPLAHGGDCLSDSAPCAASPSSSARWPRRRPSGARWRLRRRRSPRRAAESACHDARASVGARRATRGDRAAVLEAKARSGEGIAIVAATARPQASQRTEPQRTAG